MDKITTHEIRVDRELTNTNAITVLALTAGSNDNTIIIYKNIGNSKQLPVEKTSSPPLDGHAPFPSQSFKYEDRILKIHNLLYGIDFMFPVLNFRLNLSTQTKEQTEKQKTVLLDLADKSMKSVKFNPPIILPIYDDLTISYSCDRTGFDTGSEPFESLNISHLMTPCYTVGMRHRTKEFSEQALASEKELHTEVSVTAGNAGDLTLARIDLTL